MVRRQSHILQCYAVGSIYDNHLQLMEIQGYYSTV